MENPKKQTIVLWRPICDNPSLASFFLSIYLGNSHVGDVRFVRDSISPSAITPNHKIISGQGFPHPSRELRPQHQIHNKLPTLRRYVSYRFPHRALYSSVQVRTFNRLLIVAPGSQNLRCDCESLPEGPPRLASSAPINDSKRRPAIKTKSPESLPVSAVYINYGKQRRLPPVHLLPLLQYLISALVELALIAGAAAHAIFT